MIDPHFLIEFTLKTTKDGGRHTPCKSGIFFNISHECDDNCSWGGKTQFVDAEWQNPGDSGTAYLTMSIESDISSWHKGSPFFIKEGARVVGHGIIKKDLRSAK